jgi:hypothetical protein
LYLRSWFYMLDLSLNKILTRIGSVIMSSFISQFFAYIRHNVCVMHFICAFIGFTLLSCDAHARSSSPAEQRTIPFSGVVPACDDEAVLNKIKRRFAAKEAEYWHSNVEIVNFSQINTTDFRPNGSDYTPRRYCSARVMLSNHTKQQVFYSVAEDAGIIGATWGVTWCVTNFDRHGAYAPACKMARP